MNFVRHYIEMVIAMLLGMGVLVVPSNLALGAVGVDWSQVVDEEPALMFLRMATIMTLPMVGWMMYRGHGWRANADMTAAMFVPTFAVIGLLWAGVLTNLAVLMVLVHVAMLGAMAAAMLLRPDEYAHGDHEVRVVTA